MNAEVLDVSVGARLWYQGAAWTVVEHDGAGVLMRSGEQFTKVHGPSLVGVAEPLDDRRVVDPTEELGAVVLASLTTAQRADLQRQAAVFDEHVLHPAKIGTPANERYQAVAMVLGISLRTAYRRGQQYADRGLVGLVDTRLVQSRRPAITPEWDAACSEVLGSYRDASNPTVKAVLGKANALYLLRHPQGVLPSRTAAYRRVSELDTGRYTFGAAKQRRSVAQRPTGVLGRLRADRPGQYVVLDTTRLDVFAMEPVTGRWLNTELTVAMDLHSRCVLGLSLRPVSTTARDVAAVLHQVVTAQHGGPPTDHDDAGGVPAPYVGVPENLLTSATGALPDTIVVDHGKVYLAAHAKAVCHRLGINIQPATPHKPTDKPTVERFFRTLRQQLLEHLPAYKGPDVYSRGKDVEAGAFYYVPELEALIREWVGIYHHSPHRGLADPRLPAVDLSPAEMFARGMATSGVLRLPATQDLRMEFLDVAWRTIQHYGVEIDGRRYDGPGLNLHRGTTSPHTGAHPGKWPFMVNRDDVRTVYFRDPDSHTWHDLVWEHAHGLHVPFSAEAAEYTRRLSTRADRHVDPGAALADLLRRYAKGAVTDRREQNLARRVATRTTGDPAPTTTAAAATSSSAPNGGSSPDVIDLLAHLERRRGQPDVVDDADVFERYYADHPDGRPSRCWTNDRTHGGDEPVGDVAGRQRPDPAQPGHQAGLGRLRPHRTPHPARAPRPRSARPPERGRARGLQRRPRDLERQPPDRATAQLTRAYGIVDQVMASGRRDGDKLRGAVVIDAAPALGKTTIATRYARDFHRKTIRRHGNRTPDGHQRLPVAYVPLNAGTTLKDLNLKLLRIYGHPAATRATRGRLGALAVDCVASCQTQIIVIDDLHFIDFKHRNGHEVSNHLEGLANEMPVTFVYVGVRLREKKFFDEGLLGADTAYAQTSRRATRCEIAPFTITTTAGARAWTALLGALEAHLLLADPRPGMLTAHARTLHRRTQGCIGSLTNLLDRACYLAIATGAETITADLIDQVTTDNAAQTLAGTG